jgi:hypothetical protein
MFYRCKKVQYKPINIQVRDQIQKNKRNLSLLRNSAPDCPVCHRTVSGAPSPYRMEPTTLGFQQARSAIIHQTVRCTSGAMAIQRNGRLQQHTDNATVEISARQSQSADSEAHRTVNRTCPVWHRTVRCGMRTKPPTIDCSRILTVG